MFSGQQVTDTLRLSHPLGQGAMGSVWVANHLTLGTQVAVKFMAPAFAQKSDYVERFRREAMAAAQIKSPHVAQVFDHGVTASEGLPFIVMELLEGEDLKRRLLRVGALPPPEVARILSQVAKALGRAHQLGIVHRDIKPDNLFLLDVEGEVFVKVLDFGVAKQITEGDMGMTSTGSMLGTPLYMSPEQLLSSKHVDFRADLWGLTVVAYHALTGTLPFYGETLGALSVVIHHGVFAAPSQVRPGLSPAIDAWAHRALQTEPAARFGSAKELSDAFDAAVFGGPRKPFTSSGEIVAAGLAAGSSPSGVYPLSQSSPLASSARPVTFGHGPSNQSAAHNAQSAPPERTFAGMTSTGHNGKRRLPLVGVIGAALAMVALLGAGATWVVRGRSDSVHPAANEPSLTPGPSPSAVGAVGQTAPASTSAPSGHEPPVVPAATSQVTVAPEPLNPANPGVASTSSSAAAVPKPAALNGRSRAVGAAPPQSGATEPPKSTSRVAPKDTIGF